MFIRTNDFIRHCMQSVTNEVVHTNAVRMIFFLRAVVGSYERVRIHSYEIKNSFVQVGGTLTICDKEVQ